MTACVCYYLVVVFTLSDVPRAKEEHLLSDLGVTPCQRDSVLTRYRVELRVPE
jgi:hypothetical protein